MTYTVCIDWLSFTAKEGFSDDDLLSTIAPAADKIAIAPQFGYTTGFACTTGVRFFTHYARLEMGTHYVISGEALRDFAQREITSRQILDRCVRSGGRISRLDLAKDAVGEAIDLRHIGALALRKRYTGNAQSATVTTSSHGGYTLYVGSRVSERFARIYDKAAKNGEKGDWIRAEIETKGRTAQTLARWLAADGAVWADAFGQIMEKMFMIDDITYRDLVHHSAGEGVPKVQRQPDTEAWIKNQVMPAVTKYLMQHPDSVAIAELYVCIGKYLNKDVI
jgi:hypothetical protein